MKRARSSSARSATTPPNLIINFSLAMAKMFEHDYQGAEALLRKTLEMDPGFEPSRTGLVELHAREGKYEQALAEIEALPHGACSRLMFRAGVLGHAGKLDEARALAQQAESCRGEHVAKAHLAAVWMALGEKDEALAYLQKSCAAKETALLIIRLDPDFDAVRGDPRYKEVLRCARLE
jgi:thioredoxin-like negative regulator of GroEL